MSDRPTTVPATPVSTPVPASGSAPAGIDPRGPRFGAAVTAALLVITLLLGTGPAATALLAVIALLFALGVARGVSGTLQGLAFKAWIPPSWRTPAHRGSRSSSGCSWWAPA
jgi:hypothetical protein